MLIIVLLCPFHSKTRKSSCVTIRGVPSAVLPARGGGGVLSCPVQGGGGGYPLYCLGEYPLSCLGGRGTPILFKGTPPPRYRRTISGVPSSWIQDDCIWGNPPFPGYRRTVSGVTPPSPDTGVLYLGGYQSPWTDRHL